MSNIKISEKQVRSQLKKILKENEKEIEKLCGSVRQTDVQWFLIKKFEELKEMEERVLKTHKYESLEEATVALSESKRYENEQVFIDLANEDFSINSLLAIANENIVKELADKKRAKGGAMARVYIACLEIVNQNEEKPKGQKKGITKTQVRNICKTRTDVLDRFWGYWEDAINTYNKEIGWQY